MITAAKVKMIIAKYPAVILMIVFLFKASDSFLLRQHRTIQVCGIGLNIIQHNAHNINHEIKVSTAQSFDKKPSCYEIVNFLLVY